MSVQTTIIVVAVVFWFAQGWYLNSRLAIVHKKLDLALDQFNRLRDYLYEIDPQFDDERELWREFEEQEPGDLGIAGKRHLDLTRAKEQQGRRTLNSPL